MIRRYSELIKLPTFEERFEYLKLSGSVGAKTFGKDRYLNQDFYHSDEWRRVRAQVIARDLGRDLGVEGRDICHDIMINGKMKTMGTIEVHHMNPVESEDILNYTKILTDPEYLICVSPSTHKAIHYGKLETAQPILIERAKHDTCPWRKELDEQHS